MKKTLFLFLTVAAIALSGCGNKDTEGETKPVAKNVSCKEILETVLDEAEGINTDSTLFYDDEKYEEFFEYLYNTSPDRAKDGAYGYASEAVADEITIIYATEKDDVEVIENHLEERIERRAMDFEGYKPEEVEKLYNAVIDTNGQYVFMVVSENPQDIIDLINDTIEEKEE